MLSGVSIVGRLPSSSPRGAPVDQVAEGRRSRGEGRPLWLLGPTGPGPGPSGPGIHVGRLDRSSHDVITSQISPRTQRNPFSEFLRATAFQFVAATNGTGCVASCLDRAEKRPRIRLNFQRREEVGGRQIQSGAVSNSTKKRLVGTQERQEELARSNGNLNEARPQV